MVSWMYTRACNGSNCWKILVGARRARFVLQFSVLSPRLSWQRCLWRSSQSWRWAV